MLALVALVLAAVVAWAAGEEAARDQSASLDARLGAQLRAASAEFATALDGAERTAESLAGSPAVQRALAENARGVLVRIARERGDVAFYVRGDLVAGSGGWLARRAVSVRDARGREVGRVVAGVPLDGELVRRLERAAGLRQADSLAIVRGDQVVAGVARGPEWRSLAADLLAGTGVELAVYAPDEPIDDARSNARKDAFLAALLTLALLTLLALTVPPFLRDRREAAAEQATPARRRATDARAEHDVAQRMRDIVALVGEALAASHDRDALLPVILESAIGATGAVGARLVSDGREVASVGRPERGAAPLALRLGTEEQREGLLLLYPPAGGSFDAEAGEVANWLAGQASIALENARLHELVERQALIDGLTGLANRRAAEEALAVELSRAERLGGSVALVFADLDGFKDVNDKHGHPAGDDVLREFAQVLLDSVRDIDLAARWGGEEFAIILPGTDASGAESLAERVRALLSGRVILTALGAPISLTASLGVATAPPAAGVDELVRAADAALYAAKGAGKNRVAVAPERTVRP